MVKAKLTNKRWEPNNNGMYAVDVTCPECCHTMAVTFSGWAAIRCRCGAWLERTPYRKAGGTTTSPTA